MSGNNKNEKDDNVDCVVLPSKSKKGRYYRFNKRTGERLWCSRDGTEIYPEIPAKPITNNSLRTPAQDRLKRLRNNLKTKGNNQQKNKNNENKINEKAKADLDERINARNKIFGSQKYSTPTIKPTQNESVNVSSTKKKSANSEVDTKPAIINETNKSLLEATVKSSGTKNRDSVEFAPKKRKLSATQTKSNEAISPTKIKKVESQTNEATAEPTVTNSSALSICVNICNKVHGFFKKKFLPKKKTKEKIKNFEENKKPNVSKCRTNVGNTKVCETLETVLYTKRKTTEAETDNDRLQLDNTKAYESLVESSYTKTHRSPLTGRANERLQLLRQSLKQQVNLMESNFSADNSSINKNFNKNVDRQSERSKPQAVSKANEIEQMDWEPAENTIEEFNINSTVNCPQTQIKQVPIESLERQRLNEDILETYELVNENLLRLAAESSFTSKHQEKTWLKSHFYFVLDTNVLMSQLTFTDDLTKMKLCNTEGTVVYVPYIVLQELDKLKHFGKSESAKQMASRAIRHLNVKLEEKNKHLQAQSVIEDRRHLIHISSPDDRIINCCLQIKENIESVLLLTEDVNLQNKALCSNIMTTTKSNLLSKHPETTTKL